MRLKFIDLFCGAGGFSRGFMESGFEPILAIDLDESAVETYKSNFPDTDVMMADMREIHSVDILEVCGEPDVIIASPPCEAFTTISKRILVNPLDRLYTDSRGRLMLEAIRIIGDINPAIFIIENVPGIMSPVIRDSIIEELGRGGYDRIYFNILLAERFGCPSHRRRVFISNVRIDPAPRGGYTTVWEAIGDLGDPRLPNEFPDHDYIHVSGRMHRRIVKLKWGNAAHFFLGGDKRVYKQFIRLHPNRIAPTVMGSSRFIHPYDDRLLTVREQARLMSFPDDHVFVGSYAEKYNQVGEAVPPVLSKSIADRVKEYFKRDELHSIH